MVRINSAQSTENFLAPLRSGLWYEWLWIGALVVLPFASYLSLTILVALMISALVQRGHAIGHVLWRQGYGLLTVGLLASAGFAVNRGDAWLQLANFLPYFLLVGVLTTAPRFRPPSQLLTRAALALVLGSLPFSVAALIEYIVRFPTITAQVSDWSMFNWVFDVSFAGHRAHGGLSHPNILSNYLTLVLGLGLGWLVGQARSQPKSRPKLTPVMAAAVTLAGMGIFCTSSRNGLIAAVILLLIAGYLARRHRWVWMLGLVIFSAMATGLFFMGFGGRTLDLALFTQDPRIAAWRIAIDLIQQRPLVGWGLGGFSHQYVPFSVTDHERLFHPHNLWLYLACDTGIPTMVLFCGVVGRSYIAGLRRLVARPNQTLLSYLLGFTGCMIFALFDVTLFDARLNVLSWFLLAGIGVLAQRDDWPTTKPSQESLSSTDRSKPDSPRTSPQN
ncbi:O-antigen ligase family protein [Leptothoe sp. PORK10 BA2]|uniref:O-antigen ligase family protein n=1 Tax=Leptothoe sp. PORK10 BA2 TaxID=3110254 RepID=UPI002B1F7E23|nr:O-antigen ligase family protein [Leptothoe sp. PORK10 BA2]MEA5462698.1 O-antigen ligase family protein [Leptothoe sp. PORK10 BA2]